MHGEFNDNYWGIITNIIFHIYLVKAEIIDLVESYNFILFWDGRSTHILCLSLYFVSEVTCCIFSFDVIHMLM
jgi:hypothetical protein